MLPKLELAVCLLGLQGTIMGLLMINEPIIFSFNQLNILVLEA